MLNHPYAPVKLISKYVYSLVLNVLKRGSYSAGKTLRALK